MSHNTEDHLAGSAEGETILVEVNVVDRNVYGSIIKDDKYEADSLMEVRAWIDRLLTKIPEEYRASARIAIDSVGGYEGEHHVELKVYYFRPETEKERAARSARLLADKVRQEVTERGILAKLKQKYG